MMQPDNMVPTPDWADDLVIYEIATKAFTSPRGPESGAFDGVRSKVPYLRDLGITAMWLTGHSLSDASHFYNIWTQYACIRPDQLDPTLGDEASFRALVVAAHEAGIKVFLDVITHGVITGSPLIDEHPDWFRGGTWGMTDYDWAGGHADLDAWWVATWVRYVQEFGVDGFRLDVSTYRFNLWAEIRRQCAQMGHPIVIIPENGTGMRGVTDFLQHGIMLSNTRSGLNKEHGMLANAAEYLARQARGLEPRYAVTITYDDGATSTSDGGSDALSVGIMGTREERVDSAEVPASYVRHMVDLKVDGAPSGKTIAQIEVRDGTGSVWELHPAMHADYALTCTGDASSLRLSLPVHLPPGQLLSVQLSCHDNGWEGFPEDRSPYVAQGSRCVFGYSCLLAPAIPVFMAGEEFAARFRPLPRLSPHLYGDAAAGKGRWLYGSWIEWEQLDQPEHAEMLDDVTQLVHIRREAQRMMRPLRVGEAGGPLAVPATSREPLPAPYLYHDEQAMVLVAGNPHDRDVKVSFAVPLHATAFQTAHYQRATDLWADQPTTVFSTDDFQRQEWTIPRDRVHRGGLLVLRLEPCDSTGRVTREGPDDR